MGRQGEGGGLKILKNEETSFMDDPYCNDGLWEGLVQTLTLKPSTLDLSVCFGMSVP